MKGWMNVISLVPLTNGGNDQVTTMLQVIRGKVKTG
jgi:hypothetical protein